MKIFSQVAIASLLALGASTAMASDAVIAQISVTGTGVAACSVTAPASVSLGNIISGRASALLTPVSVAVDCTVPWSLVSSTNGILNVGSTVNAVDLVSLTTPSNGYGLGSTFTGNGATAHTALSMNIAAYKGTGGSVAGPVGTGAVSGIVNLTLTY